MTCHFRRSSYLILVTLFSLLITVSTSSDYNEHSAEGEGTKHRRGTFNTTCNHRSYDSCDYGLYCSSIYGRCLCSDPSRMTFDYNEGSCALKLGEYRGYYSSTPCVTGAQAGIGEICSCPAGTIPDSTRSHCVPRLELNQTCSSNNLHTKCNENKLLACTEGTCQCDLRISKVNPAAYISATRIKSGADDAGHSIQEVVNPCLAYIGSPCFSNGVCPPNSLCSNRVCKCDSSYTPNDEGVCTLPYGAICDPENSRIAPCNSKFRCIGKIRRNLYDNTLIGSRTCSCPNPSLEEYDSTTKTCRGLVGSPCNLNGGNSSCVQRASCVEHRETSVCKCDEGYIATVNGTCQLGYKSSCNYTTSLHSTQFCFQEASLVCIDGSCECPDAVASYDQTLRRCVFPVGVACKMSSDCGKNADCLNDPSEEDDDRLSRTCSCKTGFVKQSNGSCGTGLPLVY